jgi:glycine cleavage system H protein
MSMPADRKYATTHEWYRSDSDVVTLGITQFAADELTDITYVELPDIGTTVSAGKAVGEIESVKATSEIFSAVDGKIVEVNEALNDHPELINEDAFEKGWIVKIAVQNDAGLASLMDADAYAKTVAG